MRSFGLMIMFILFGAGVCTLCSRNVKVNIHYDNSPAALILSRVEDEPKTNPAAPPMYWGQLPDKLWTEPATNDFSRPDKHSL